MAINWDYDGAFVHEVTVTGEDIDGLMHTNNGCYVGWCEQAAWSHSQSLGLSLEDYQTLDRAMAVRHAYYDYLRSTYLNDRLLIGTWLANMSGSKMKRYFQIFRGSDDCLVLSASWELVCIEISSGRPKRLPEMFIEVYGTALQK